MAGQPFTAQQADTRGRREITECFGRPSIVRSMLAGVLHEAKPKDFILAGFFYFRFDIQVIFADRPELFEGLGAIDFTDEHGVHWKGASQWPVIFLIGRYNNATMLVIDAWRFFQGSLENVCKMLELPFKKMKHPPCIEANREPTEAERPYFDEYSLCDADACLEILKRIDSLWDQEANVGPCISVAHMSGRIFRRDHTENKGLDVADEYTQQIGLAAYKGGRNSLVVPDGYTLPLVVDGCKMYDVRSLYPYICSEVLPAFFGGRWIWSLEPELCGAGIYLLKAELKPGLHPAYRLLMDERGDYLAPGPIHCAQTGYEIIAAMKYGMLEDFQIVGAVWKSDGETDRHPFKEFYGTVFEKKEAQRGKNPLLYSYYKAIANCLTGKFVSTIPLEETVDGILKKVRVPGMLFNPPVGALITGAGRALLFENELASSSLHGATDSLVVPPWGRPPKEGAEMGGWELAAQGRFVAARNKLYAFLGPKTKGGFTGWEGKTPYWQGQAITKYALHAFKGTVFQFLDAVFAGKTRYSYSRMVQVKESRKRKNLKPLQMNDFVEELKLGGKYYTPSITNTERG